MNLPAAIPSHGEMLGSATRLPVFSDAQSEHLAPVRREWP